MSEDVRLITKDIVKPLLPKRSEDSHKGTYGKVLNIAGSQFYQGAAILSSLSPLKCGAGLVTLASIESVINNLVSSCPCVTYYPVRDYRNKCVAGDAFVQLKDMIETYNVVSIGCGLSDLPPVSSFLDDFMHYFKESDTKLIFDADALNVLSTMNIQKFPRNAVLTPHPMELSRLIDVPVNIIQSDRLKYVRYASHKFECTVVLKGRNTLIGFANGVVYENNTGSNALSKAGTGDVLTGMIAGFSAQGLSVEKATILAVYLHGLCGELVSVDKTNYCVLATDLIEYLPKSVKMLIEE